MNVKMILPALTEAKSPFFRPIKLPGRYERALSAVQERAMNVLRQAAPWYSDDEHRDQAVSGSRLQPTAEHGCWNAQPRLHVWPVGATSRRRLGGQESKHGEVQPPRQSAPFRTSHS